jgi:hypothetical protein
MKLTVNETFIEKVYLETLFKKEKAIIPGNPSRGHLS